MVLGEGAVFLLILSFGIYRIRKSISKELALQQQQQNFLLTITHELKTPIAALKLYLQTLRKHQLTEDKKEGIIHGALEENERLGALIENILNATKAENKLFQLQKEELDLSALTQNLVSRYQSRFSASLLELQMPAQLMGAFDPHMLETIFVNLLENAIKYGGTQQ